MVKGGKLLPAAVVFVSAFFAGKFASTFVPAPPTLQRRLSPLAPAATAAAWAGIAAPTLATPLEDAALKLADASYPAVKKLLGPDKNKLADVVSKVVSETNYDAKVAATADKAIEALLVTDTAKVKVTLDALDKALDDAVSKGGLVPPIEDVQSVAKAVAASVESSGGAKFKAFIDGATEQGSVVRVLEGLGFDAAAKDAFANFISAASAAEGTGAAATGAVQAPAALEAAAVKFADASYPIVQTLNTLGGKTIAPLAGKAIGIAFSGDPAKVGKAADAAVEVLASANQANVFQALSALEQGLNAAVANNGLLPPLADVENVAKAAAGALATVGPGKLSTLLGAVIDAGNSADKFKVLGILGEGSGLVAKINPGDVAAATSAAVALASASGAQ